MNKSTNPPKIPFNDDVKSPLAEKQEKIDKADKLNKAKNIANIATITGIKGIQNTLFELKQIIDFKNPMDVLEEEFMDKYNVDIKKFQLYKKSIALFSYRFHLPDGKETQVKIGACLTEFQKFWDKATQGSLVNNLKFYQMGVVRGAMMQLYSAINPFNDTITLKSKDSTHIMKLMASIETNLASLASIEEALHPRKEDDCVAAYERLPKESKANFIQFYLEPYFIMGLDPPKKEGIITVLASDPEFKITINNLLIYFERLPSQERVIFLQQLLPILLPPELRLLSEKLVGASKP